MNFRSAIISVVFLSIASFSHEMEGTWKGTCLRNGEHFFTTKVISEVNQNSISINQTTFNLGSETVFNDAGSDELGSWSERTTYDWNWDNSMSIRTNARWIGGYLNRSESWSGKGQGRIELDDKDLMMSRDYRSVYNGESKLVSETCFLRKMND